MKLGIKKAVRYIKNSIKRAGGNNISICTGELSQEYIIELKKHFKKVESGLLGYTYFEL